MNRTCVLLLLLGWGCQDDPIGPVDPICNIQPATAIPTFEDANLEAAIRVALGIGAQNDPLTCDLVSGLTTLNADLQGIQSLVGIENLESLVELVLSNNSINDVSPLAGLTRLTDLWLVANPSIADIQPLLDNANRGGLGAGDTVYLLQTSVLCPDVALLRAKDISLPNVC